MIAHHPSDELLLAAAAGTLDAGAAIVLGAHLEGCATCRAALREFEAVGGAMLESTEPALMAPDALAKTLAAIDAPPPPGAPRTAAVAASEPACRRRVAAQPGRVRRVALALDGAGHALEPRDAAARARRQRVPAAHRRGQGAGHAHAQRAWSSRT